MIHLAIGAKAQFIKMAPIIVALQEKSVAFNLIDLGKASDAFRAFTQGIEPQRVYLVFCKNPCNTN